MNFYSVEGVLAEDIPHVWDECWPHIRKSLEWYRNPGPQYTEAQFLQRLADKTQQLWIGWNMAEHCVQGVMITETNLHPDDPSQIYLFITIAGGKKWNDWGDDLWSLIKEWAIAKGCTHAVFAGRKGWGRLYGFDTLKTTPDGTAVMVRKLKG